MKKAKANMKGCFQPMPKILVSCRDKDGNNNALAVAYCSNCSYAPPMLMVGIVPSRYSYHMIKETGCLVVNLVTKQQKEMFDYLGSHSGRDEDKFAKLDLKIEEGIKVNAPILTDCPVNIECKIVDSIVTGSHEMFACQIEHVHANEEILDDKGNIDFKKVELL